MFKLENHDILIFVLDFTNDLYVIKHKFSKSSKRSSSPKALPLEALTEPDVKLSLPPALIIPSDEHTSPMRQPFRVSARKRDNSFDCWRLGCQ
jgi:hypothetical protein